MSDYYDYDPTHALDKPLVLVSFVNELTRAVANSLASTTGLPLRLLDDIVEHHLGTSSVELLSGGGLAEWRERERDALSQAVTARPPAVIAVGEGALANEASLASVLEQTNLVYLYLSFDEAKQRVFNQAANRKATLYAELSLDEEGLEQELLALFSRRRAAYERAHRSLDVHGMTTAAVGKSLLESMALS